MTETMNTELSGDREQDFLTQAQREAGDICDVAWSLEHLLLLVANGEDRFGPTYQKINIQNAAGNLIALATTIKEKSRVLRNRIDFFDLGR